MTASEEVVSSEDSIAGCREERCCQRVTFPAVKGHVIASDVSRAESCSSWVSGEGVLGHVLGHCGPEVVRKPWRRPARA